MSWAHYVIPTPVHCAKVVQVARDENHPHLGYRQIIKTKKQWRYACCLANVVRYEIFTAVVANRRQP